jgi:peptidoglycan/LPS O-acetylase OafA/YrhL
MSDTLCFVFALAAAVLFSRLCTSGSMFDLPLWSVYVAHLPFAAIVWAFSLWNTHYWISGLSNILLAACSIEAMRACCWWVLPAGERKRVMLYALGCGLALAGFAQMVLYGPQVMPVTFVVVSGSCVAFALGTLLATWLYQRYTHVPVVNAHFAWHAGLLACYCALNLGNWLQMKEWRNLTDDLHQNITNATLILKISLFGLWLLKVVEKQKTRVRWIATGF